MKKAMMFLYGLNCVALFVGYCVLFFLAVLLLALIVSYAAKRGKKQGGSHNNHKA